MRWTFSSKLLLLTIIQQTHQQDLKPHILCEDGVVTIDSFWSGRIQHKSIQSSNPDDCALTLKGLKKGSYVSIPGVDVLADSTSCLEPRTYINNIRYCVKGTNSTNQVLIRTTDGTLVVYIPVNSERDFIFSYFTDGKFIMFPYTVTCIHTHTHTSDLTLQCNIRIIIAYSITIRCVVKIHARVMLKYIKK